MGKGKGAETVPPVKGRGRRRLINECYLKDGIERVVNGIEGKRFMCVDPRKGAERLMDRPRNP